MLLHSLFKVKDDVSYEELKDMLMMECDSDFNGTNGMEYVSDSAKELGFKSNLELSMYKNKEKYNNGNIGEFVNSILLEQYLDPYYKDFSIKWEQIENFFIFSHSATN